MYWTRTRVDGCTAPNVDNTVMLSLGKIETRFATFRMGKWWVQIVLAEILAFSVESQNNNTNDDDDKSTVLIKLWWKYVRVTTRVLLHKQI